VHRRQARLLLSVQCTWFYGTIELRTGDRPLVIETADGSVTTRPGSAEDPDLVLAGPPELIVSVLTGKLDFVQARAQGLQYEGDPKALRRVQPRALKPV
jgi:hypothetical protein